MDVFYYWKNHDDDLRKGRIGWLKSDRLKLGALKERFPSYIWAFKTPPGRKGELQLLARLVWSDHPKVALPKLESPSVIYYDPADARTVFFNEPDTEAGIPAVTSMLRSQYPAAFRANFQGDNGIQVMDGDFLRRFQRFADQFSVGQQRALPVAEEGGVS